MRKAKTVLCGGCFNAIHEGHIWFLNRAKSLGDSLVVVVASDAHNRKPYAQPAAARARALRALGIADKVIIGSSEDFFSTISKIKPRIIALGYDQALPAGVSEKISSLKISVRRLPRYKNFSTSALHATKRSKNCGL